MPRLASYARNPRPHSAIPVLPASPAAPASRAASRTASAPASLTGQAVRS